MFQKLNSGPLNLSVRFTSLEDDEEISSFFLARSLKYIEDYLIFLVEQIIIFFSRDQNKNPLCE